ncbi:hypothetical protein V6Z11_D01G041500 [Gossypium hirsutum]
MLPSTLKHSRLTAPRRGSGRAFVREDSSKARLWKNLRNQISVLFSQKHVCGRRQFQRTSRGGERKFVGEDDRLIWSIFSQKHFKLKKREILTFHLERSPFLMVKFSEEKEAVLHSF